jgi:chorismate dehydratase
MGSTGQAPGLRSLCYTGSAVLATQNFVNPLRISVVQYLNTAPLVRGFTHGPLRGKYALSFTVPSQCAEELRSGTADIAIIPAIEYPRIPNLMILPDMAVASKKTVRSLLLVSKKGIPEIRSIALDRTSRSTQTLVHILCNWRWRIAPECFEAEANLPAMLERADAALLIGDPALKLAIASSPEAKRNASGEMRIPAFQAGVANPGELLVLDIVEQWRAMTNLPAVLAVWAARNELATPEVVQDFQDSLAFGLRHLDAIVQESAMTMNLPASDLRRYFTDNIDYQLDEENLRGLTWYYSLAARLGLIRRMDTVAIAATPGRAVRYMDFSAAKPGITLAGG